MSHLEHFAYPGFGEEKREQLWYNQAVRIGDRIECAGQGGWDHATSALPLSLDAEIDQAFENVQHCLEHAGGKGWAQVFRVNVYVKYMEGAVGGLVRNLRKWAPEHRPVLTAVGVTELVLPGMRVEIEVSAHDPN